jgi:parallel beta-helix repeat protein
MSKSTFTSALLLLLITSFLIVESAQCTDTSNTSWISKASLMTSRSRLGAAVINGEIYAFGGDYASLYGNCIGPSLGDVVDRCEKYSSVSDTWIQIASMPTARCSLATVAYNNKIYCIGGFLESKIVSGTNEVNQIITGTNEVYAPSTDQWQTVTSMPTPRMDLQAHLVNGKIYLIGGSTEYGFYLPNNEVYDPVNDTWSTKTPCPYTIASGASATINGKIFFLVKASQLDLGAFIAIYDPSTDQWSIGAQAPIYGGISAAACAIEGKEKADNTVVFIDESSTYFYYPANNTWAKGESNPTNVGFPAVVTLNGKLHVIGGIEAPFEGYIVMTTSVAAHMQYTPNVTSQVPEDLKIFIRQDGSIYPSTANITTTDKITYSVTDDIYQRIVIQKDNTILDGHGHTIYGQSGLSYGISIFQRTNVVILDLTITQFDVASIGIDQSTNIFILRNTLSKNVNNGLRLYASSNNTIMGNTIVGNQYMSGIQLMDHSNNNNIIANNIKENQIGLSCFDSSGNIIYHNNFLQEHSNWINHAEARTVGEFSNKWDNGSPSGGNYWVDNNETDPYVINEYNRDNYPLTERFDIKSVSIEIPTWTPTPTPTPTASEIPQQESSTQPNQTSTTQLPLIPIIIAVFLLVVCSAAVLLFRRLRNKQ